MFRNLDECSSANLKLAKILLKKFIMLRWILISRESVPFQIKDGSKSSRSNFWKPGSQQFQKTYVYPGAEFFFLPSQRIRKYSIHVPDKGSVQSKPRSEKAVAIWTKKWAEADRQLCIYRRLAILVFYYNSVMEITRRWLKWQSVWHPVQWARVQIWFCKPNV